ncbi:MAG: acyl-CoA dehydrogenase family protein [Acidovorax soli]|uniref:acyl-CoA dehydrogenase family protein n=1 Tax=Acidovorax soli TaxID=592050 RepID=UPI0026F2569D|nr:acyl-CoA dehydrogenase family protein [Acidovorax soli]MCM2346933.1 acyl-CoA dehydrogenase family protein [Acidovorax soli]
MKPTQWLDETDAALADAAQRYLQDKYPLDARMRLGDAPRRFDARVWSDLGHMGWCAVSADEALGGLGFRPTSIMLLSQAAGRALLSEPFISSGVVPARLLSACVPSADRDQLFADALAAQHCLVATPPLTASAITQGCLNAKWQWIPDADIAWNLLVPVEGQGLYVVPAGSPGLAVQTLRLLDGRGAASVALQHCGAVLLRESNPGAIAEAYAQALLLATLAVAADSVGVMQGAMTLTLEYLKTRRQFGTTLGSHQVLQHRAVDMHIRLAESESVVRQAMRQLASGALDSAAQVHAAKAVACDSARLLTQEAVQLHGGIGITEEYAISHYLRRARVNEQWYGSTEHHLQAFTKASTALHP